MYPSLPLATKQRTETRRGAVQTKQCRHCPSPRYTLIALIPPFSLFVSLFATVNGYGAAASRTVDFDDDATLELETLRVGEVRIRDGDGGSGARSVRSASSVLSSESSESESARTRVGDDGWLGVGRMFS